MTVRRSGQARCYTVSGSPTPCLGTGQDAETLPGTAWPEPRFEPQGTTVLDTLTGLMWLTDAGSSEFPLPWQEAQDFCSSLDVLGRSWRLPTRSELWGLVGFDTANPALPLGHPFTNVFSGWYWTATPSALTQGYYWRVQFSGGRSFHGAPGDPCMVWPVSGQGHDAEGTMPASPRFKLSGDGQSVLDTLTSLTWLARADLSGPVLWQEALDAVRAYSERSGQPWRLPTIVELESLVDLAHAFPALTPGHPFTALREAYWSSTTSGFETDWAMAYYQEKGAVGVGFKAGPQPFHVWPVLG